MGSWTVAAQVAASVDVLAWGRNGPALLATSGATDLTASVTATLPPPAQGPAVVFGAPTGTRLEVGGATASAAAHLAQTGSSLALNADVTKSKLVIAGGDSFVSSLLPDNGLEANFDLGIGWSSDKGLTLRGSAGLQTDLPVSLSVGGVTLSQLHLALLAGDAGVTGEISGILSASIGPVQAAIDRVGIAANLSFPDKGGNLGGGELAVGFKPPSGVGIALDMQGLTGGGFLTHDDGKILAVSELQDGQSHWWYGVYRWLPNGDLDRSFGSGGWVATDLGAFPMPHAVALQADGKILVVLQTRVSPRGNCASESSATTRTARSTTASECRVSREQPFLAGGAVARSTTSRYKRTAGSWPSAGGSRAATPRTTCSSQPPASSRAGASTRASRATDASPSISATATISARRSPCSATGGSSSEAWPRSGTGRRTISQSSGYAPTASSTARLLATV